MNKKKKNQLKVNKLFPLLPLIIILILLITVILTFITSPLLAQEATPSAVSEDDVEEKIKESWNKFLDEDLDKIKGVAEEIKKRNTYAYSGIVKEINDRTLKIETDFGEKQTKVASPAAIVNVVPGKLKDEVEFDFLEIDQFVICMGYLEADQTLDARRVVISPEPTPTDSRKILTGKVEEIDNNKLEFTDNGDGKFITLSKNTELKIIGLEKPTTEDIQIGDKLRAIVSLDEEGEVDTIKAVLIMPGEASPVAEENEIEATPSATPEE